ncbi:MAG: hypothetical protein VX467_06635 [Verrucomicrobiota bacterium]|nr:hypothetical protein [Verrucomicrobiota bacterium]
MPPEPLSQRDQGLALNWLPASSERSESGEKAESTRCFKSPALTAELMARSKRKCTYP